MTTDLLTSTPRIRPLSARQQAILVAVLEHWSANGYSPSIRELMDATGTSSLSVLRYNLRLLRDRGLLTYADGEARTIRPVHAAITGWADGRPVWREG